MRARAVLLVLGLVACGGHIADSDASVSDASTDAAKPPHCVLAASDYDTTCTASINCVSVYLGNACTAGCLCENAVIAKSSLSAYQADLATVDAGNTVCPCPPPLPPSCCNGQCTSGPCP